MENPIGSDNNHIVKKLLIKKFVNKFVDEEIFENKIKTEK